MNQTGANFSLSSLPVRFNRDSYFVFVFALLIIRLFRFASLHRSTLSDPSTSGQVCPSNDRIIHNPAKKRRRQLLSHSASFVSELQSPTESNFAVRLQMFLISGGSLQSGTTVELVVHRTVASSAKHEEKRSFEVHTQPASTMVVRQHS
jgi:hypothetical protein